MRYQLLSFISRKGIPILSRYIPATTLVERSDSTLFPVVNMQQLSCVVFGG